MSSPERCDRLLSELRRDPVSGEWIVIAPHRAHRPGREFSEAERRRAQPKRACPFEPSSSAMRSEQPFLVFPGRGAWRFAVIPNKFPAFQHGPICPVLTRQGLYETVAGGGRANLLVFRDHRKHIALLPPAHFDEALYGLQRHSFDLASDPCIRYVALFQNWGLRAGATISHPHFQIMAVSVVPPDVRRSLDGSRRFFRRHQTCVHCRILGFERRTGRRIVYENAGAVAYAPFASHGSYEVRVFPKRHSPYFERASRATVAHVARALRAVLRSLYRELGDPDYNFFIHSAPIKRRIGYPYYHWHIEVLPKMSISAGFELGTGIDVAVVDPDEAAQALRMALW